MEINSSGVVCVGSSLIVPDDNGDYTSGGVVLFETKTFYGINETGMTVGGQGRIRGKKGQGGGAFRMDENLTTLLLGGDTFPGDWAGDVNDDGDVCFKVNSDAFLFYKDLDGLFRTFNLDELVVFDSIADKEKWFLHAEIPWGINNIDSTGFGQICGFYSAACAWILTPEPVQ